MKIKHLIKFYADTTQVTNYKFTFKINSKESAKTSVLRFAAKGWKIHAAYYIKVINGIPSNGIRIEL